MSWQAYVDTSLVGTGEVDKAAIFSVEGTSVWAASPGFNLAPAEVQVMARAFQDEKSRNQLFATGIHLQGQKYLVTKAEETVIYARKGKEGVIVAKTKQAMLIAHYDPTMQAGNTANVVEKLAAYLVGVGY